MAPTQKSQKRPSHMKRNETSSASPQAAPEEAGAGLWRFFPLVMALLGAIVSILLQDSSAGTKEGAGQIASSTVVQKAVSELVEKTHPRSLHDVNVDGPNCGAASFLSPTHAVSGFHLACLEQATKGAGGDISVTLFLNGQGKGNQTLTLPSRPVDDTVTGIFASELSSRLKLDEAGPDPPNKFPWAMYTPDGQRKIVSVDDALASSLVFIFKGGSFIWPGVEVGHTQTVTGLQKLESIEMKTLSMEPLVFEAKNFLLEDECQHIKAKADPHMKPSPVSLMDHDKGKPDTDWRTSTTYFMPSTNDPALQSIDERVEQFTRVPRSHQEQVQVLKYDKGQRYSAHHDFFNPKMYQKDARTLKNMDGGRKNRMITVFWYLSDVEEGGETIFPRAGGHTGRVDFSDCTKGMKVKPVRGKVAMFYSMRPDGQFDDFSLHGACPVVTGQKWAANKWVWSAPVQFG